MWSTASWPLRNRLDSPWDVIAGASGSPGGTGARSAGAGPGCTGLARTGLAGTGPGGTRPSLVISPVSSLVRGRRPLPHAPCTCVAECIRAPRAAVSSPLPAAELPDAELAADCAADEAARLAEDAPPAMPL